jgi:hypothetical protein
MGVGAASGSWGAGPGEGEMGGVEICTEEVEETGGGFARGIEWFAWVVDEENMSGICTGIWADVGRADAWKRWGV